MSITRPSLWFALIASLAAQPISAADSVDYVRDVKPLLAKRCYACHGALQQKNGLRLDTAAALLKGGEAGGVVVPGKPTESLLIQVVTGDAGFRMPPAGDGTPLSEPEIGVLRRWIAEGATGPAREEPQVAGTANLRVGNRHLGGLRAPRRGGFIDPGVARIR